MKQGYQIFIVPSGDLETNSVVIAHDGECVIFDPDGDANIWINFLNKNKLTPVAIYLTHGHYDHMGAVADLCENYNINWHMNFDDKPIVALNNSVGRLFGAPYLKHPKIPAININDNIIKIMSGLNAEFIRTPGHTPGSGIFYFKDLDLLISGDTIFSDTVGRCDLPLGSFDKMKQSIHKIKSLNLPANTRVIPGHGDESTMGWIMGNNSYFMSDF